MKTDVAHLVLYGIFASGIVGLVIVGVFYPEQSAGVGTGIGVLTSLIGLAAKSPLPWSKDEAP